MARMKMGKVAPWQKKVILEFLDIVPPNSIKVCDALIESAKTQDPAGYREAYNIVVNKTLPDEPEPKHRDFLSLVQLFEEKESKLAIQESEAVARLNENFREQASVLASAIQEAAHEAIKEASEKIVKVEHEYKITKGKVVKKVKGPLPECFQDLLDLAGERINILMVGPSGCGKTHIAAVLAESLGLDYSGQSCSAGMSESMFSGWLLPIEKAGQFAYVPSEFVRIYENGGVFLFDEIDASDSNTLLFLNQALANDHFYLPQRHKNPKVVKHKDFIAVAAANTYGGGANAMYAGRNILDSATMDRFRMGFIEMDYSPVVEESIIDPEVLELGRLLREQINHHGLRRILSTRFMVDATKMRRSKGWSMKRIFKSYFSDWTPEEIMMIGKDSEIKRRLEADDA